MYDFFCICQKKAVILHRKKNHELKYFGIMKKLLSVLLLMAALVSVETIQARNMTLAGSIGPYKIHMVLNDNTYEGYYYYDKNPKSRFKLHVSRESECTDYEMGQVYYCDGCSHLTLQEYTPAGKNSGQFSGVITYKMRMGYMHINFSGTFLNKGNGKQYEFGVGRREEI